MDLNVLILHCGSAGCFKFSSALNEANLEKKCVYSSRVIINGMLSVITQLYNQVIIIM